jgi:hypothetical protein
VPHWGALFGQPSRVAIPAELADEAALLAYLGLGGAELRKIWYYRRRMYRHFSIAKGPNKVRIINAPDKRLKFLQRKLADKLTELYRPRNPVHGFVIERSVKTNALAHLHRRFVVNIDLKDFFPTISQNRNEACCRHWELTLVSPKSSRGFVATMGIFPRAHRAVRCSQT